MRFFAVALIFFGVAASYAQTPEVPHKMHFADMTLTIRDDARREIQKDVDALTQHPRYFNIKVERAKTYFPIIDKIFEEERLPLDFKYLVLQESALIADAVSVSNAVGFWQFKDFTAMEMGLRVDKEVDERMNIHSATRAAARYLKKNNFMFNNWLLALQSYQMGGGGVQRSVGDKYNGARHMDITSDTYWYIKKYLAHKVAFENAVKGEAQVKVSHYPITSAKSFSELSNELAMEESVLRDYNKWIRKDKIPADKTYVVVIPTGKLPSEFNTLNIASSSKPEVIEVKPTARTEKKRHNGILAIQAMPGETTTSLAKRAGVGISEFLKFNEIPIDHTVMVGSHYYLARKKIRSSGESYTVRSGDDWWLVSQQTGVQLKRLKKYNKQLTASLKAGDVVRLDNVKQPITTTTNTAPVLEPIAEETIVVAEIDSDSFFNWEVRPKEAATTVQTKTQTQTEPAVVRIEKAPADSVRLALKQPEATAEKPATHQVKQGETLYAIAKQYNVGVTDLLEWNSLEIASGIKPGQVLAVKPTQAKESVPQTPQSQFIVHEVKESDTLYSVARQYNVTIKDIMEWNKKEDFKVSRGEKLRILTQ
ncbi:MAG TPA: LysM peptidoglycan-binding domain-containing protein [Cyclobacteriaceae bacterium]|nr:LysM peptidoglycan-binding domain-containing protein [Cyclobacteriaceae bacterium]